MKRTRNLYHYEVRKLKKSEDLVKKNELLDACLNGGGDLFKQMKAIRNTRQVVASTMDGVRQNIPNHFKNIYSSLLAELLSIIIQCYLIHGHVTRFLLLATLLPIIKDKLGSICNSKNYRSIAISSMILKLLDWIIILLFDSSLKLHDLQFAYQPGISGNMCTYAVLETIDYFLRHGSEVFMCTMDMTKAFDTTVHSILFSKMLQAGVCAIYLRLLIFIYSEQFANVRWNGKISSVFSVHCEDLFRLLEQQRSGCWVNGYFLGLLGYSDDNICLAPSLKALQDMLDTCQEYTAKHNLKFSTDNNPEVQN